MTTVLLLCLLGAVLLGTDRKTGQNIELPYSSWATHYHLIGGTGKGKTTALETILHYLLIDRFRPACHFIIDRMGSFSYSLLTWIASRWCPQWVRERLVYIEGANERVVMPFNPLAYSSEAEGYYRVCRAADVILRAWANQNIEETPRLARWIFNAFYATAQLGLTIADCAHLLFPGSPFHDPLLRLLPPLLQAEWREILEARGGEAQRMLEAPRNRLSPFINSPNLRALFSSTRNNLDVLRFLRERRIVLVNLAPMNRLSVQAMDAIGSMLVNEILSVLRSLPPGVRYPVFVWLDEFQRFAKGPDIAEAIPEMRQLMGGGGFVLSHQSLSQLESDATNLREIIYQCQSRMIFGMQGREVAEIAEEIASITYDPHRVKDEMQSLRQIQTGHEMRILKSWSDAEAEARNWSNTYGSSWSAGSSRARGRSSQESETASTGNSRRQNYLWNPTWTSTTGHGRSSGSSEIDTDTASQGGSSGRTEGGSRTKTRTTGGHEQLVPVLETFYEVTRRSFYDFSEQAILWGQSIRNQKKGQCLLRLVDTPGVFEVDVTRHAPGYLAFDLDTLRKKFPQAIDAVAELISDNFASELFVTPEEIERETKVRLERLLCPPIEVRTPLLEERVGEVITVRQEAKVPNPMA